MKQSFPEFSICELRIGNFLRVDNDFLPINGIKGDKVYFKDVEWSIENAHPIPITEKWLLKLGFHSATENAGNLPCFQKGKYTMARWGEKKWQFWISTVDIYNSPQYIHQLQNLYNSLSGEELKVPHFHYSEIE